MKYHLTQQQFTNLEEAVNFWLKVPREAVCRDLDLWRSSGSAFFVNTDTTPSCETPACFGGWLPYSTYFSAMGVTPESETRAIPTLPIDKWSGSLAGKSLAAHLFGERELFASRNMWDKDYQFIAELGDQFSDWGLVLMRLAYVLENAELRIE